MHSMDSRESHTTVYSSPRMRFAGAWRSSMPKHVRLSSVSSKDRQVCSGSTSWRATMSGLISLMRSAT